MSQALRDFHQWNDHETIMKSKWKAWGVKHHTKIYKSSQ